MRQIPSVVILQLPARFASLEWRLDDGDAVRALRGVTFLNLDSALSEQVLRCCEDMGFGALDSGVSLTRCTNGSIAERHYLASCFSMGGTCSRMVTSSMVLGIVGMELYRQTDLQVIRSDITFYSSRTLMFRRKRPIQA